MMSISFPASSDADPRRSDKQVPFRRVTQAEEDKPVDVYFLGALLFCMMAMVTKLRFYPWLALLMVMASYASMKQSSADSRGSSGTLAAVVVAFVTCYVDQSKRSTFFGLFEKR